MFFNLMYVLETRFSQSFLMCLKALCKYHLLDVNLTIKLSEREYPSRLFLYLKRSSSFYILFYDICA